MINLNDYGYTSNTENKTDLPARITAVHRDRYEIVCEHGTSYARLKASIYYGDAEETFPTVGDFVLINYIIDGDSQIIKTLPRKAFFSRFNPTPGQGEQAVAANFDYVFIMMSLNNDFNINRTQRYLTLAWQSGGTPVIILTKSDLADDYKEQILAIEKVALGVVVCAVSAKSGDGIDMLSDYLKPGKTIVFLGSSGVGKSSLVNALMGEEVMAVNEIREDDSKGRHTTTHRQLIMLKSGVMVIDTPGMRELGMMENSEGSFSEGLSGTFAEIEELFDKCKFTNCTHASEPGCAVIAALEDGTLDSSQWRNYQQLKREAKFNEDKAGYMSDKQQWRKSVAKLSKDIKKRKRNGGK